jgi:hypothetical protein
MTLLLRSLALLLVLLVAWPQPPAHATPSPRADQVAYPRTGIAAD